MSPRAAAATAAALAALLTGCRAEDRTPGGAARLFLQAVETSDSEALEKLVAQASRKKLAELLHLANAQAGGPRKLKAKDLLVAGMNRLPTTDPLEAGKASVSGDRATVEVLEGKKSVGRLDLVKTGGGLWRVVLPERALAPPEPGGASSRPTSRPT
jgi:hypothetical protein